MFQTLFICGFIAALTVPVSCCRDKEFTTRDGQCCPMCHEGTVVRRDCTLQSGTRCVPCEDGTFMNKPNGLTRCFTCATCDPGLGLFEKQKCTATTDTVCDVLSGYFCTSLSDDATGCSLAQKHKDCESGQRIKEPGTNRSDRVCEACQTGYYSQDGVNCTAWTVCSKTQRKVKEGSPSQDVVCVNASRSHHYLFIPFCLFFLSTTLGWFVPRVWISHKQRTTDKRPVEEVGYRDSQ